MIRSLLGGLGCLLVALAALADPVAIRATPVPLDSDQPDRQGIGRLAYIGGFRLDASHPGWGGFSDLELAEGEFRAVSDSGWFLRLPVTADAEGRLLPPIAGDLGRLLGPDGQPLEGKGVTDAEAMARLPDGSLVVGFERHHRLLRYPPPGHPAAQRPVPFPAPDRLTRLPLNGGIEALVGLGGGRLLALAEEPLDTELDGIAWMFDGAAWHRLGVDRSLLYKPTAATLLPGGDILLLERRFTLIGAFAARVSRIPAAQLTAGGRIRPQTLAELATPLTVDNMEGIAVGPGPKGETFVYLISDDNRTNLQRTLLLQFRLME